MRQVHLAHAFHEFGVHAHHLHKLAVGRPAGSRLTRGAGLAEPDWAARVGVALFSPTRIARTTGTFPLVITRTFPTQRR
ncbi:hypothetical protein I6J22_07235 [Corynebacterium kroppenstedtii]|uniref:Uncharacterized protein n=1 Tax=Corynebacterium kroppenstedtii (strain DSM 44385 / JCM 11950 / CIP 105744 / CCUG 35717) TaxID=645127 RepID=C4LLH2_CORK4|nr:hypothetical protein [Corynebacterium kroppenstedtii]ACR18677.1 hypothetical protein ckrop_1968 [Corynebacterium kroppenstedtii DSM 44385]QRP10020.1 hypothetical protein I6J22_07235 [Corynebacterium kroppenstedtii]HJD68907.1 hypothetical protein [Corynebacterium kroppenstedtii]